MPGAEVFFEDWSVSYGAPYLVDADDAPADVRLVEDGDDVVRFHGPFPRLTSTPVAFVDGVRRGEAVLYLSTDDGFARGLAGAHGTGAVLCDGGATPRFDRCAVRRLVVWGSGQRAELPAVPGGWSWQPFSTGASGPAAPLVALQRRMREAEGRLAEDLCEEGWLTVVDGPLNYVRSRDVPVVGYVKTHGQPLLAPEHHARVPELAAGQRTSLFLKRPDIYSAYLRLTDRSARSGPWAGVVRVELPSSVGIAAASRAADRVAAMLPAFAGVAHVDPRAPQNLQPVGALERELRHRLGDLGLAVRAVRAAVSAA
jgi:hypothetical protein